MRARLQRQRQARAAPRQSPHLPRFIWWGTETPQSPRARDRPVRAPELMGHARPETTEGYLDELRLEELEEALHKRAGDGKGPPFQC